MYRYRKPWRLFLAVFKEALPFIGLSFLILTSLVFLQQVGKYSSFILSLQASNQVAFRFMLSLIPSIVIITLPVALLLGTVIACSRLSSDGELTAAQSLGVSKASLALPFVVFGLIGTLLIFYLSGYVAPRTLRDLRALRAKIRLDEASTLIRPHAFITTFPDVLLYVQDVDPRTGEWLGVFILQQDQEHAVSRLLTSERGRLRVTSAPSMVLEAELYRGLSLESRIDAASGAQAMPVDGLDSQAASDFEKFALRLTKKEVESDNPNDLANTLPEMTFGEVAALARGAKSGKDRLQATVEWHKRLAFSFACLTLTSLTFILVLGGKRFSTRPRTVIVILFVAMGFYLLLISGRNLSLSGAVPAWLGVWLSNLLLSAYVIRSFVYKRRLSPVFLLGEIPSSLLRILPLSGVAERIRRLGGKDAVSRRSAPSAFGLINLINYLIVTEVAKYYLLAMLALVITSIVFTLFDLIPSLAKSGSSLGYAAAYLSYLAPQLAYHVSPFALLVAILTGCSVLARSNQLVILAGAGQSKTRIIMAVMIASSSLGLALWLFSDYLLPFTNREQDIRYHKIKNKELEQTTIAFGKKWVFGKNNIIYSYQKIDSDNSLVSASMYHLSRLRGVIERATYFGRATQLSLTTWQAVDGWMYAIKPDLTIWPEPLQTGNRLIRIEDGPGLFKRTVNESSKMSSGELSALIRQLDGIGIGTTELQLDLKKRVAFPFSCLTLALLAMPFATTRYSRRTTPMVSVALGVGISLAFWMLMIIFEAFGKQSSLPVSLAVWGPQILLLTIGMYLNFRYRSH